MWIICKYGHAINTDLVARFRQDGDIVRADMAGLSGMMASHVIGETTVEEIIMNITMGRTTMEVQ